MIWISILQFITSYSKRMVQPMFKPYMFIYFWTFRTKCESPTSIESGNETLEQKIFFRNTNLSTPVKRTWKEMKKWTHTFAAILFYNMILRQEYSKKYSMHIFWCHCRGLPELKISYQLGIGSIIFLQFRFWYIVFLAVHIIK